MKANNESKTDFGTYDEKGHWRPPYLCTFSPFIERPLKLQAILKYLFGWGGYLWPRNAFYAGLAVFTWFFLQAGPETTAQLGAQWIGFMLLRNIALMWFVFGRYHLLLYTFRVQGNERKYNPQWQEKKSKKFLFNNQVADNIFMSSVSGGLIWTVYEVFYIWAASTRLAPLVTWADNPIWFVAFFLIIPSSGVSFRLETIFTIFTTGLSPAISEHRRFPGTGGWEDFIMARERTERNKKPKKRKRTHRIIFLR